MTDTAPGIMTRTVISLPFMALKSKETFPRNPLETSIYHWLELVEITNPVSVASEDNKTMIVTVQVSAWKGVAYFLYFM